MLPCRVWLSPTHQLTEYGVLLFNYSNPNSCSWKGRKQEPATNQSKNINPRRDESFVLMEPMDESRMMEPKRDESQRWNPEMYHSSFGTHYGPGLQMLKAVRISPVARGAEMLPWVSVSHELVWYLSIEHARVTWLNIYALARVNA